MDGGCGGDDDYVSGADDPCDDGNGVGGGVLREIKARKRAHYTPSPNQDLGDHFHFLNNFPEVVCPLVELFPISTVFFFFFL